MSSFFQQNFFPLSSDFTARSIQWGHVEHGQFVNQTFTGQAISVYAIFNDQSFNNTLSTDIVSFKQLSPDCKMDLFK